MSFDYFYGQQSDLFTFYRVPKVLFTNERFWNISADAKMLYGILLDRMSLSAKNGWIDKNGRVYIIFTKLKVYKTDIPRSVRAEEISAEGHSIFKHDPKGKVADAYRVLTKEVLNNAEKRRKHQLEGVR